MHARRGGSASSDVPRHAFAKCGEKHKGRARRRRAAASLSERDQKARRKPIRNTRWSRPSRPVFATLLTTPKPLLAMLEFGLRKCGVFDTLKISPRNSMLNLSVGWNLRKIPMSTLIRPGPRNTFEPHVPKRGGSFAASGSASVEGSHQPSGEPSLTGAARQSANCPEPTLFNDPPGAVGVDGRPV